MAVAVDVRVVGNRGAVPEPDTAPVVEQDVPVHDHSVSHFHVVAEGELDLVEGLEVPAAAAEDAPGQDAPEEHAQIEVLAQRAPVEHLPHPEQGLDPGVPLRVDVGVVLRLDGDVGRIHLQELDALRVGPSLREELRQI